MVIETKQVRVKQVREVALVCDRCARRVPINGDSSAGSEVLRWRHTGGWDSAWGDGMEIAMDLCGHCVHDLFRPYARVIDPDADADWVAAEVMRAKVEASLARRAATRSTAGDEAGAATVASNPSPHRRVDQVLDAVKDSADRASRAIDAMTSEVAASESRMAKAERKRKR